MSLTLDRDLHLESVPPDYDTEPSRCQRCDQVEGDCSCYRCPRCHGQGGGYNGPLETACGRCDGTGRVGWLTNSERATLVANGYLPPEVEEDDDPTTPRELTRAELDKLTHRHDAACGCHLCAMDVTVRVHDDTAIVDLRPATVIDLCCYWCHRTYGTKDGHGVSGVSHGVCPTCCVFCGAKGRVLDEDHLCPECVFDMELIAKANTRGTSCMG